MIIVRYADDIIVGFEHDTKLLVASEIAIFGIFF
jgi:hypothetical protein